MRLFAALLLPRTAIDGITRWYPGALSDRPGTRRVSSGNLHLTLRFFGDFPPGKAAGILNEAWASCGSLPMEFRLTTTGCFRGGAVWVGGTFSPGVFALAEAAGSRSFVPHITVARTRGGDPPVLPPLPAGISGRMDGMALFESTLSPQGPVYTRLFLWGAGDLS